MSTPTLKRPKEVAAEIIRNKIEALRQDRATAEAKIEEQTARRSVLLRTGGGEIDIHAVDELIKSSRLVVERADMMILDLSEEFSTAEAAEAAVARKKRVARASTEIAVFNETFRTQYEAAVEVVAGLIALERAAWGARAAALQDGAEHEVPQPVRVISADGRAVALSTAVQLPPGRAGGPFIWPKS